MRTYWLLIMRCNYWLGLLPTVLSIIVVPSFDSTAFGVVPLLSEQIYTCIWAGGGVRFV